MIALTSHRSIAFFLITLIGFVRIGFAQFTVSINPIDQVLLGSSFTVSGNISIDANSTIPAGIPIQVTIQVISPDGSQLYIHNEPDDFSGLAGGGTIPVSYTHLTLPTILRV